MISISKVPREARWSVFHLLAALAVLAALVAAPRAHAFGGILSTFNSTYPGSNSGANASCQLCHGNSTSTWNEYGWGLRENGQDFAALEGLPSININGVAESNGRVSAYMRNIDGSDWMSTPKLSVIESKKGTLRSSDFVLTTSQSTPKSDEEEEG